MRKRRFIIVGTLYAAAIPAIYFLITPLAALVIGSIMVASVALALLLAGRQQTEQPRGPQPLSEREQRLFGLARRTVLVGAIASLMTWASVCAFYWDLRGYFLMPGLASCAVIALAIYGILHPAALSSNIMRFQMMVAFGYSLVLPLFVAYVLVARLLDTSVLLGLAVLPLAASGFFIQRWRERSVQVQTAVS
jgi:hypothetical protein